MSRSSWQLSSTDNDCKKYRPGHRIHWIRFNQTTRGPSLVISVAAAVHDDGLVHIDGDGISLVRWNHRPAVLRAALQRLNRMADWKPRWHILAVPSEAIMGSSQSVFNFATPSESSVC